MGDVASQNVLGVDPRDVCLGLNPLHQAEVTIFTELMYRSMKEAA